MKDHHHEGCREGTALKEKGDLHCEDSPSSGALRRPEAAGEVPKLPHDGSKVWFHRDGCAWKSKEGSVTVETVLGPPTERQGFEKILITGAALGLKLYERSHAQGAGTGRESPYGIALAPRLVNQELQNHGVEDTLREIQRQKRDDAQFKLRTEVWTSKDGVMLHGIHYELYGSRPNEAPRMIFAASISIQGLHGERPKAMLDGDTMNWSNLEHYLKPVGERDKKASP